MPSPRATALATRIKARDALAATPDKALKALIEAARAQARSHYAATFDPADPPRPPRGRPPLATPKQLVSLRLDQGIISGFRATGPGWQSRINAVLNAHLPAEQAHAATPTNDATGLY